MTIRQDDTNDKLFQASCDCYLTQDVALKKGDTVHVVHYEPRNKKLIFRHNNAVSYTETSDVGFFECALRRGWLKSADESALPKKIVCWFKGISKQIIGE